jgi:D-alanyl-D-alanine-carboxypeptidase/D-alanyl-D-alanine-endopeptidase
MDMSMTNLQTRTASAKAATIATLHETTMPSVKTAIGKVIFFVLLACATPRSANADPQELQSALAKSEVVIKQLQESELWVGGSLGLVSGEDSLIESFGSSVPGSALPVRRQAVFEIGSLSKTFTGILLSRLLLSNAQHSESALDSLLDSSLANFLPELRGTFSGKITLRQLARHESGLPSLPCEGGLASYCLRPQDLANPYPNYTRAQLTSFLQHDQSSTAGPFATNYSNLGYATIGLVLERLTGKDFSQLFLEQIATPLGLSHTRLGTPQVMGQMQNLIGGFNLFRHPVSHWSVDAFAPALGFVSTIDDMLKFLKANASPSPGALGEAIKLSHKLGLGWDSAVASANSYKNGETGGFTSMLLFNEKNHTGTVVLSNIESNYTDSVAYALIGDPAPDLIGIPATAAQLEAFVGTYVDSRFGGFAPVTISRPSRFLMLQSRDLAWRLNPRSEVDFNAFDGDYADGWNQVQFEKTSAGSVKGLFLKMGQGGGRFRTIHLTKQLTMQNSL